MIEKIKLGIMANGLGSSKADKEQRLKVLEERIRPVLSFLEKHNIEPSEVNSREAVLNRFRKDFPFPDAPEERNFELMGINVAPLTYADSLREFNKDFYFEDGKVKIKPEWYEANEERFTMYTRTKEEVKAYEYANKLMAIVQEGKDEGFLKDGAYKDISNCNDLVDFAHGKTEYSPHGIYQAAERHERYLAHK